MFRAAVQKRVRETFKAALGRPVEDLAWRMWKYGGRKGAWIEYMGLPRRSVEKWCGSTLTIDVPPESLDTLIAFGCKWRRRRLGNRFIWDGDWDCFTKSFQDTLRYRFLKDIWDNRHDLAQSNRFAELMDRCERGKPYRSYHKGVYLDSAEKILSFLDIYLAFMKQIQKSGYDPSLSADPVGAALDRRGRLVKINKGLHRLAMAQIVGVERIPVRVRAVHRFWWEKQKKARDSDPAGDLFNLVSHLKGAASVD